MSPQVVGLLLLTFAALVKTTNGQAPIQNSFFGQGEMLDHECYEQPYRTTCVGPIPRFFYNATTKHCEQINNVCGHGGSFSLQECDNRCTCRLRPEAGTNTCHGAVDSQRFFFNQNADMCLPFTYYGCEGNGNNFGTSVECTMQCNAPREIDQGDVMRSLGFTNEKAFEAQAGLFNYGAPAPHPPPPPRPPLPQQPKFNPPVPSPQHPPSHPSPPTHPTQSRPFPPPPRHPPSPPTGGHFPPTSLWNNHPTPTHRPRWQPPPPPPNQRSSYTPDMRSPRPPPNKQPPFGNHPMSRQIIPPPSPHGTNNGMGKSNRNPNQGFFGKTTFSMNNVQDKPKHFTKNPISRSGPRNNRGGMNWNRPNQGQVTIQPTPIVSMAQSTMMPMRNNWRGNINQGHQGPPRHQGNLGGNNIAPKPTKSGQGITAGSLNQPKVEIVKATTTQSSVGLNNRGTTDYYYYDNTGYSQGTTAGFFNNLRSSWGNMRRRMGK
ncbi:CASP-like protein 4U1 [Mizuhopecten yessoensis]|uniref:Inter-alpha-trypsin inhibitor n=1 Tax=Mizuhopecten yessoensis TaxID=6573 RepID=A0A210Q800_MIZYE|nr:CASP-like protein 4U1 [Mizuhopecten yessoensis]OWF44868.1 Inter-alpha-trypsin inhibitor [Mizuhopecten yessoensis]